MNNIYLYFYNALQESINSTDEEGTDWYASPKICNIRSYFGGYIQRGMLYSCDEFTKEFAIGRISELTNLVEEARNDAYQNYVDNK